MLILTKLSPVNHGTWDHDSNKCVASLLTLTRKCDHIFHIYQRLRPVSQKGSNEIGNLLIYQLEWAQAYRPRHTAAAIPTAFPTR